MSPPSRARRVLELVVRLYPADFRREYGEDILALFDDRVRFESGASWRVALEEAVDVLRTAAVMRTEHPMSKLILVASALFVGAVVAFLFGPVVLVPLCIGGGALALWWARHDAPIRGGKGRGLLLGGVALLVTAFCIPAVAGDELSEPAWTVFAVTLLGGLALSVVGVVSVIAGTRGPAAPIR